MTSYAVLLAACLTLAAHPDLQHMHQDLHACIEQAFDKISININVRG